EVPLVLVDRLVVADQRLGVVPDVALVAGAVRPHDAEDVVVVGQVVLHLGVSRGQVVTLLLVLLGLVVVLVVVGLGRRGRRRGRRRPELPCLESRRGGGLGLGRLGAGRTGGRVGGVAAAGALLAHGAVVVPLALLDVGQGRPLAVDPAQRVGLGRPGAVGLLVVEVGLGLVGVELGLVLGEALGDLVDV